MDTEHWNSHSFNRDAYIATVIDKSFFAESVFHISQVNNSYDILRNKDSRTGIVPQACGLPEQWGLRAPSNGKIRNVDYGYCRQFWVRK